MGLFATDGDARASVRYSNGDVVVKAGDVDRLTVSKGGEVTLANDLTVAGGLAHDYVYTRLHVLQGSYPIMTSSITFLSGTAAAGNTVTKSWTTVPLPKAGSVLAVSLNTEGMTVKSGSLSASVVFGGVASTATVGINTGSVASRTYAKDAVAFAANTTMSVALTASSTYLTDTGDNSALSGSVMCVVSVEF